MKDKRQREAGFTLIELMIVLFILGLLAALVAPRLMGRVGMAKIKTAQTQIQMLATTLDLFHLDVGRYPTEEEGLKILYTKPDNLPDLERPLSGQAGPQGPLGPGLHLQVPRRARAL